MTQDERDFLNSLEDEYEQIAVFGLEKTFSISNIISAAEVLLIFIPKENLNELKSVTDDKYFYAEELEKMLSKKTFEIFEQIYDEANDRINELFPYVIEGEDFRKIM